MEGVKSIHHASSVSIAQELNNAQNKQFRTTSKRLDIWLPHKLKRKLLMDRLSIWESLLIGNKIDPLGNCISSEQPNDLGGEESALTETFENGVYQYYAVRTRVSIREA